MSRVESKLHLRANEYLGALRDPKSGERQNYDRLEAERHDRDARNAEIGERAPVGTRHDAERYVRES